MVHRKLILNVFQILIAIIFMGVLACGNGHKKEKTMDNHVDKFEPFFKISLAQWSLHKAFEDNGEDPFDFLRHGNYRRMGTWVGMVCRGGTARLLKKQRRVSRRPITPGVRWLPGGHFERRHQS